MKRVLTLSVFVATALSLTSCGGPPPPQVIHHHHYRNTTRYVPAKPSSVSTGKSSSVTGGAPEAFQAVTPPSSYSR